MKKLLFLSAITAMAVAANAQTSQGSFYIGGSLGFGSTKNDHKVASTTTDGPKYTNWNFSPEVGYFVADKLSVGLGFNIAQNKSVITNPTPSISKETQTNNSNGITLYGRKFMSITDNFNFFAGLDINIGGGKIKNETESGGTTVSTDTKTSMMGANLNAGIAFAITPKVMIYGKWAYLGWSAQKSKYKQGNNDVEDKSSSFGLNVNTYGSPFTVGMYFTL